MTREEFTKALDQMSKAWNKLLEADVAFQINEASFMEGNRLEIHTRKKNMDELFPQDDYPRKKRDRDCKDYPKEVSIEVCGCKVFYLK